MQAASRAAFLVDVVNPPNETMDISYSAGDEVTALGQVAPGATVRFSISNHGSDDFELMGRIPSQPAPIHHPVDLKAGVPTRVVMTRNDD